MPPSPHNDDVEPLAPYDPVDSNVTEQQQQQQQQQQPNGQMTQEQREASLRIQEKIAKRQHGKQQSPNNNNSNEQQQQVGYVMSPANGTGVLSYQPMPYSLPIAEISFVRSLSDSELPLPVNDDGLTIAQEEDWDFDVKDQLPPNTLANGEIVETLENGQVITKLPSGEVISEEDDDNDEFPEQPAMMISKGNNGDGNDNDDNDIYDGPTKAQRYCWYVVFGILFILITVGVVFFVITFANSGNTEKVGAAAAPTTTTTQMPSFPPVPSPRPQSIPILPLPAKTTVPLATPPTTLAPTTGTATMTPTLTPTRTPTRTPTQSPTTAAPTTLAPSLRPTVAPTATPTTIAPTSSEFDLFLATWMTITTTSDDDVYFYMIELFQLEQDFQDYTEYLLFFSNEYDNVRLVFDMELNTDGNNWEFAAIVQYASSEEYRQVQQNAPSSSLSSATWACTLQTPQDVPPLLQSPFSFAPDSTVVLNNPGTAVFWHQLSFRTVPQYNPAGATTTTTIPLGEQIKTSGRDAMNEFDQLTAFQKDQEGIRALAWLNVHSSLSSSSSSNDTNNNNNNTPDQVRLEWIPSLPALGSLLGNAEYREAKQHREAALMSSSATYQATPQTVVTNLYANDNDDAT
mmetsp:Transcript_18744/g.28468  ORF Transcript_18744/g.28468 Transcript_18744/m.28468 type:complete len:628 (-) Transcript_18744:109-1992(-)